MTSIHGRTLRHLPLLATALLLLTAPATQAIPRDCWEVCTVSTPCSTLCYDGGVTTCGESFWLCDDGSPGDPGGTACTCSNYIFGSSVGDTLNGTGYNDCISGSGGNDTLYGHSGGDELFGDGGNDTLYGGSGDDCLVGGSGTDHLDGGTGNDVCTEGEAYVSC